MLLHNLKIAFRNMWKYKNQTLISVIGLAVGFTCFALATLWIRFEMTFDNFHKNAKQMYVIHVPDARSQTGYSRMAPYPLAAYLKETFPEISDATPLTSASRSGKFTVEDVEFTASMIRTDSSFFRMFDVKILEGSRDFVIPGSTKLAITQEKSRQLFGNENPIGKIVNNNFEICAIVSEMSRRSNYRFDFIGGHPVNFLVPSNYSNSWSGNFFLANTIIELFPGTNIKAFEKKLYEHNTGAGRDNISNMKITPLTKVRYTDPTARSVVTFQQILIFAISGILVILCSLFNYLTLFISRFRMRHKEFALRAVCGASDSSLFMMLSVEFILMLLFAVGLGGLFTQLAHEPFLVLSDIQMNLSAIYMELVMYIVGVIFVSLFVFWLILFIFRHKSLTVSIRQSNKKLFRMVSVIVQLVISIGFAFCTIIIFKQMYFLHNSGEMGFSFRNTAAVARTSSRGQPDVYSGEVVANLLKQIPEITEIVYSEEMPMTSLVHSRSDLTSFTVNSWDDQNDVKNMRLHMEYVTPEYTAFYNFRLVAGEMLTHADSETMVLLNESAVKAFGWYDPVGKQFVVSQYGISTAYTVKGVIKNIYNFEPTVEAKPYYYSKQLPPELIRRAVGSVVLFKYREGMWESCKEKIEELTKDDSLGRIYILNSEEEYSKYLKSENILIKLLSFFSAICVLICVFGFVSLVSLNCKERRKEIAIRKINGATVGDILAMFAKEYFMLLIIGAVIAFTTGYFIMQRWLENYVVRTNIPAWIYLSIIFVMALVIVLCVGWQVYKSSVENPAEVVKSE